MFRFLMRLVGYEPRHDPDPGKTEAERVVERAQTRGQEVLAVNIDPHTGRATRYELSKAYAGGDDRGRPQQPQGGNPQHQSNQQQGQPGHHRPGARPNGPHR